MMPRPVGCDAPRRRVLWLTKGLGRGGAEQLLVDSVGHLDRERFDVEVAYLLPWKDALVPSFAGADVQVHCLHAARAADPRWAVRLRRVVRDREIDLVHTHMPYPAIGARTVLAGTGTPLVHTEHNLWDRYHLATRWANAATYNANRAVLAVSRAVADSITVPRWAPGHVPSVEVVYQGADMAAARYGPIARAEARRLLELSDDALVIGTVANFTPKKDHATLLTALAELVPEFPALHWVVVGVGPLEDELRLAVERAGLRRAVSFTGLRDDVPMLLPGFDVFALSSRYEGLPISLLEAMASGVMPVVTEVGGVPEVVTDGRDGLLVPPGDPTAIAAALRKVLADSQRREQLGGAARKRAAQFDLRDAVIRTEAIYDDVLGS